MLFPTRVVVRKVSGFLVKNPIELEMRLFFREATSSLSLFAVTNAISDPEKNPLSKIVPVMRSHSIVYLAPFSTSLQYVKLDGGSSFINEMLVLIYR